MSDIHSNCKSVILSRQTWTLSIESHFVNSTYGLRSRVYCVLQGVTAVVNILYVFKAFEINVVRCVDNLNDSGSFSVFLPLCHDRNLQCSPGIHRLRVVRTTAVCYTISACTDLQWVRRNNCFAFSYEIEQISTKISEMMFTDKTFDFTVLN